MLFRFEEFELDGVRNELRHRGTPVGIDPTPLRLLFYLVQNRDRAVPKHELLDRIWPDAVVSESALSTALKDLRRVLADDGRTQRVVRTQRGHGFRFVAEVEESEGGLEDSPLSRGDLQLAAILKGDMVGFGRLVAGDEESAAQLLSQLRRSARACAEEHGGRLVDFVGDNFLTVFPSALACIRAAFAFTDRLAELNEVRDSEDSIEFRMGVHLGDVIERDGRVYGEGVVVAARLEQLADAGSICLSSAVRDQVALKLGLELENLGPQSFKNVSEPVEAFKLAPAHARARIERVEESDSPSLAPPIDGSPSLIVLPFDNPRGERESAVIAQGITFELSSMLGRVPGFFVVSPGSAAGYAEGSIDPVRVGRELGVRYAVRGTLLTHEGRVRLNAQLVDTESGLQIWSERYDRPLDDLFDLQDEMTLSVAAQLEPALLAAEASRARRLVPTALDAWTAYQLAAATYYFRGMRPARVASVHELLDRAEASDPNYPYAYSLRGNMLAVHVAFGWSSDSESDRVRAIENGQRALEISPEDPTVLSHWGVIAATLESPEKGIAALERSVVLDPNNAHAWSNLGWTLGRVGSGADGRRWIDRAMRLSPRDPRFSAWRYLLATTHLADGEWDAALRATEQSLAIFDGSGPAWALRAASLMETGRADEARRALDRLRLVEPGYTLERASFVARHAITAIESVADRYVENLRAVGLGR